MAETRGNGYVYDKLLKKKSREDWTHKNTTQEEHPIHHSPRYVELMT